MNKKILSLTQTAVLGAVALVLSAIEMSMPDIPFLLPGAKLGLSNIAVMAAIQLLSLPQAIGICAIKAMFALIMRGPTAMIMSLSAGVVSTVAMYLLLQVKGNHFGYIGVGVCGAAAFNATQILVAAVFMGTVVFSYLPFMLLFSIVSGAVTGIVLFVIVPNLYKIKILGGNL